MLIKLAVPVWCEYDDGFREPEGDVIVGSEYPKIGDELVLCDKNTWVVKAIEGDPRYEWPKVICKLKKEKENVSTSDKHPRPTGRPIPDENENPRRREAGQEGGVFTE